KEVIIIESNVNNGLANSVINGVTEVFTKHDKIIVLEDDLITARNFLRYMNAALNKYTPSAQVMEIAGFSFEANGIVKNNASFFLPITTSWGWGTWKRVWNKFDIRAIGYEKLKTDIQLKARFDMDDSYPYSRMLIQQMETTSIDSWAIRFWWHVFKNNGITLFPDQSLIKNIGYGTDGTHTSGNDPFPVNNFDLFYSIDNFPCEIKVNEGFYSHIKHYFRNKKGSVSNIKEPFLKKIILYLKKWGI
ncbi:MAG TPA: glycosyltransferase family 2 protein, partial [Bacteroidia bacterium]|nr:glycosyltransferase family 2 protein [Bacteroidia bacterium]